jgi:hypothetical protein
MSEGLRRFQVETLITPREPTFRRKYAGTQRFPVIGSAIDNGYRDGENAEWSTLDARPYRNRIGSRKLQLSPFLRAWV